MQRFPGNLSRRNSQDPFALPGRRSRWFEALLTYKATMAGHAQCRQNCSVVGRTSVASVSKGTGRAHLWQFFAPSCFETPCGPCRLRQGYAAQAPRIEWQLWCMGLPRILRCERSEPRRTRTEPASQHLDRKIVIEFALN
jgi:hypothetical protein